MTVAVENTQNNQNKSIRCPVFDSTQKIIQFVTADCIIDILKPHPDTGHFTVYISLFKTVVSKLNNTARIDCIINGTKHMHYARIPS